MTSPTKYFRLKFPFYNPDRTKKILTVNPVIPTRVEATEICICAYDYDAKEFKEYLVENHRDMIMSLQDLYMNKVNLRLNETMKVMAIVTCLLAPATVIGGIFGMNFEVIPLTHQKLGFYIAVGLMLIFPLWMIRIFKKRGWF